MKSKKTQNTNTFYDKERLESALDLLAEKLQANCYEEWMRIGFALSSIGDEGEKYFIDMSLKNPNYKDTEFELKKKYQSSLKRFKRHSYFGNYLSHC